MDYGRYSVVYGSEYSLEQVVAMGLFEYNHQSRTTEMDHPPWVPGL